MDVPFAQQSMQCLPCAGHCSRTGDPAMQEIGRAPSLLNSLSGMGNGVLAEDGAPFRILAGVGLGARQGQEGLSCRHSGWST